MTDTGEQAHEWPRDVERITLKKMDLLGVDGANRLYWNGKRVITGQRLDLTGWQNAIALLTVFFTFLIALGTLVQAWTAYNDWSCKVKPAQSECPPVSLRVASSLRPTATDHAHER
jgi:hypothetical protein